MPNWGSGLSALDLFCGVGVGVAMNDLGITELGIDIEPAVIRMRDAMGWRSLKADISALEPADFDPLDLLWASPPCTAFSAAGKGEGRDALTAYGTAMQHMRAGAGIDRGWLDSECADTTAHLVLEPLRWALELMPRWIACEQVPSVLPLWNLMADVLRERGYSTWAGILSAERYGVAQTRKRAILMASFEGTVRPPQPTHQEYVDGEPARHELTLEGELLPWVSMSEALGWGATSRPAQTLAVGKTGDGRVWGSDQRSGAILKAREEGQWVQRERSGDRSEEGFDPSAEPCQTLTEKARSWTVHRPATTIAGDQRVFQPGGHHTPGAQSQNAVRVTVEEAATLQSFPTGLPWDAVGSRTAQFRIIGNAVPPLLARAVLSELLQVSELEIAA